MKTAFILTILLITVFTTIHADTVTERSSDCDPVTCFDGCVADNCDSGSCVNGECQCRGCH
uniref:AKTx n=1 Tax=Hadrurus spadix TaxID=141984 RepID=A0A1W7RB22_9SCOR